MAAFLSEMKSVRLRKTSSGPTRHVGPPLDGWKNAAPERDLGLARSWSAGGKYGDGGQVDWRRKSLGASAGPSAILPRHGLPSFRSLDNRPGEAQAGEKRKRDDIGGASEDSGSSAKRRMPGSTTSSLVSTSTMPPPSTDSFPASLNPNPSRNRTWPSISLAATETDLTTPELLSDTERDGERGDSSLDDRPPSTPPTPRMRERERTVSVGDVDMNYAPQRRPTSPHMRESELFSKRPPSSPMPLDTPRKPRPPARPLGKPKPDVAKLRPKGRQTKLPRKAMAVVDDGDDEEDPLSLSFSSPDEPLAAPKAKPKQQPATVTRGKKVRAGSQASNASHARSTLDEELRDARARSLLREHDLEHIDLEVDLDSGELVGVGTRSKKHGFLAHGGSGGVPVFMGEGYVDGAQDSDEEQEEYQPRRSTSSAAGRRKNRR